MAKVMTGATIRRRAPAMYAPTSVNRLFKGSSAIEMPTMIIESGAVIVERYSGRICISEMPSNIKKFICGTKNSNSVTTIEIMEGFKSTFFTLILRLSPVRSQTPSVHTTSANTRLKIIRYITASMLPSVRISINGTPRKPQLEKMAM